MPPEDDLGEEDHALREEDNAWHRRNGKLTGGRGRIWPQHKLEAVPESFKGEKSIARIRQERRIAQEALKLLQDPTWRSRHGL